MSDSKGFSKIIIIVIAVVVLILAGVSYWYFTTEETNIATVENTSVNQPVTNTDSSVISAINKWAYYPNYDDIRQVIETDDVFFVAANGGVLRIDKDNFEVEVLTMAHGLLGNTVTSLDLVESKNELWVGMQGGIAKFNSETLKLEQTYIDEDELYPAYQSGIETRLQFDGLASNANIELRRDPNTGILWAGTFRGLSKYNEDLDSWSSYGRGDNVTFAGVRDVQFDEDNVWIFVTPNAYTIGGMLKMSKASGDWTHYPESTDFPIDADSIKFGSNGSTIIAASRPYDWVSAAESRGSDIYIYKLGDDSWEKLSELYTIVNQKDYVRSITTDENGSFIFTIVQTESDPDTIIEAVYNSVTGSVITREPELNFKEKYEFELSYPSRNSISYIKDGTIFTEQLYTIDALTDEFDSSMRDAAGNLNMFTCNKNASTTNNQYFLDGSQGMGIYINGVNVYRTNHNTIEQLLNEEETLDLFGGSGWIEKLAWCEDDILYSLTKEGMVKLNVQTDEKTVFSENYHEYRAEFFADAINKYFYTEDFDIGIFSKTTEEFSYIELPNIDIINVSGEVDNSSLQLKNVEGNNYWFLPQRKSGPNAIHSVFVFHADTNTWEVIDLSGLLSNTNESLISVMISGDAVILLSNDTLYIRKSVQGDFTEILDTTKDLMMSPTGVVYPTSSGTWFSGNSGIWFSPLMIDEL